MSAPFVGNNDYRGYLNYLGSQGDANAKRLLGYGIGNDAGFNPAQVNSILRTTYSPIAQNYLRQFQALQSAPKPSTNLGGGGGGGGGGSYAPPQIFAPKLDVAGLNASARSAAEGAVNPYYTKVLNEFLAQQATQRQQQQTQYETGIKNLEDTLKQNLETSQINRGRTTEDVATSQALVNQNADQFQTDTGQQFDAARQARARDIAKAGLSGGLGAQQQEKAQTARNTQEQRQEQTFQQQRDAHALFKGRTFEDLARSDVLSKDTTEKGKTQAKFDLETFLQSSQANEQNKRNELERSRLGDIAQNQAQQAKIQFNNWLATIKDPRQYLAAVQTYGGSF